MKFIIGFLIAIGLLIFVFVLIFRGGSNKNAAVPVTLSNYSNTSVVMQFTTEGPVTADQSHKEIQITVGDTQSTINVFQGYQGALLNSKSYPNNSAAYHDFLNGLQVAGYTQGTTDKKIADESGYCADGQRYVLAIVDGSTTKQRFWFSSCNVGTFKGKIAAVQSLFQAQIPDYNDISNGVF